MKCLIKGEKMKDKREKGITVISLLIAIIVMIILTGVTVFTMSSNENKFEQMVEVTREHTLQSLIEAVRMAEIYLMFDSYTEGNVELNITTLINKVKEFSKINDKDYVIKTTSTTATIEDEKMNVKVNISIDADNKVIVDGELL